jgi:hypothetical protein
MQQFQGPAVTHMNESGLQSKFHRSFTKGLIRGRRRASVLRYLHMGQFARTIDVPILLSLATTLRRLGNDSLSHGDKALYPLTAEALEKRAEWFAATFPQVNTVQRGDPMLHSPVDMTI